MNLQEVFLLAKKNQVQLWLDEGQLRYRAPQGSLSPELLELLRKEREQLISALGRNRQKINGLFPLSCNQQSLWVLHQMAPDSAAYTVAAACRIRGQINRQAVIYGLDTVAQRHEALRTTYDFWPDGSGPCQYIHDAIEPQLRLIDAQGWSEAALREHLGRCIREPFDLACGPVMRTRLFSLSGHEHILLFTLHHIACDAASVGMYIDEFFQAYGAKVQGRTLEPAGAVHDYRDFILQQQELLATDRGAELFAYWREALSGMPDSIALPSDFPGTDRQRLAGSSVFFEIGGQSCAAVRQAARRAGITVGAFLLGAYGLTLMGLSRQADFGIGVAASGRTRPQHSSICGYCVNPVVIRCTMEKPAAAVDFLQHISKRLLHGLDHQDYPFNLLVEKLAPRRHSGRQPLVQVFFNFVNRQSLGALENFWCPSGLRQPARVAGLLITPYVVAQQEGQYELDLDCIDDNAALFCCLKYDTDRFSEATAQRVVTSFQELLARLCADTGQMLDPANLAPREKPATALRKNQAAQVHCPEAALLCLPADRPRGKATDQGGAPGRARTVLDTKLLGMIKAYAGANGYSWETVARAVFAVLLHRLTGSCELQYGVSGKNRQPCRIEFTLCPEQSFEHNLKLQRLAEAADNSVCLPVAPVATVFTTDGKTDFSCSAGCEFLLAIVEADGACRLECRFDSSIFEQNTIQEWLAAYCCILNGALARPDQPVEELPVMSPELKNKILLDWNDTGRPYAPVKSLWDLLARQMERSPEADALKMGDRRISYGELGARSAALAAELQRHGVGPDVPVGICACRSLEMVIGIISVIRAGGAYVPLDPALPVDRLATMLGECRPPVVLVQGSCLDRLPALADCHSIVLDQEACPEQQGREPAGLTPGNLAYIIFTSGSTGKPKGVMNTHGGICNRLLWMQQHYELTGADRVLQKTPFGFDVSVWEFFWPLLTGACLVVSPPGAHRDPGQIKQLIARERVSIIHFVPSMLRLFLDDETQAELGSLRHVICSGEALPADLQRLFFKRMPETVKLHNLYGPTEAAVDVTYWECLREDQRGFVPIGRPIANTAMYILDRRLQPVLPGISGELYIGGAGLARGYINNPALTGESFIQSPFAAGERLYKTGDRARYLRDGSIDFLGRLDGQVKLRGCRIETGEIETVLRDFGSIQEAAVAVRPDDAGRERLVAYVSMRRDNILLIDELRAYVRRKLPDYMVPDFFMQVRELPLSPNGKIDRKALPRPDWSRPGPDTAFVRPRTETERLISEVWKSALQIGQVGARDNFFDIGGNSLLLITVARQLEAQLGRTIPVNLLFQYPSIAALAGHLDGQHEHQDTGPGRGRNTQPAGAYPQARI